MGAKTQQAVGERHYPYRIKDLVRKTGVSKETIHFYITSGLLPKAQKTSRNMAWYGDEHVERLRTIKELQEKQFLPLKAIKAVLTDAKDYEFTPEQQRTLRAVQQRMLMQRAREGAGRKVPLTELQTRYGFSNQEIAELEASKLLLVDRTTTEPTVEAEDETVFRIWSALRALGFTQERGFGPSDLEAYEHVAAIMFDQGVRLVAEKINEFDPDEAVHIVNEAVPLVNELVGFYHAKKVHQFITGFRAKSEEAEE